MELMVAITLFAFVAIAVAAGMGSALGLTRNNRNRSVAANLAAKEMDVVRSTEFEALPLTLQEREESVDGVVYRVSRETSWATKDGDGGVCSPPSGTALAFLRVLVTVTWPNLQGARPVSSETILAPPVGSYDTDTGHLAVRLRDRDGVDLDGQVVTATGPGGTYQQTTTNGCVFFAGLTPGNFTVSLSTVDYVDGQSVKNPQQAVAVTAGSVTSAEFDYELHSTLDLRLVGISNYKVPGGLGARVSNTGLSLGTKAFDSAGTACETPSTTLSSSGDALIDEDHASTNYGLSNILGTYTDNDARRSLVMFTMPAPPAGCALDTATLRLFAKTTTAGRTIRVYEVDQAWTENGVTWNNQPTATGSSASASSLSSPGWMSIGVTSIAQAHLSGPNNGFLIRDSNEDNSDKWIGMDPREGTNDPELVLNWKDQPPCADSYSLGATGDARIRQNSPSSPAGTESTVRVRSDAGGDNERSLVTFSLPSVSPACVLTGATLKLYAQSTSSGRTIHAYRAATSWSETGVTWNTQPAITGSPAASASLSSAGWQQWNVLSLVQTMYSGTNTGFVLRDSSESSSTAKTQTYRSRESSSTSTRPTLQLTFADGTTLPTFQTVLAEDLFPYPNGYQVWGGTCLDADPEGVDPAGGEPYYPGATRATAVIANPGLTTSTDVILKSVELSVTLADVSPVQGVAVRAFHEPDGGCPGGVAVSLGSTDIEGKVHVALPYGAWRFEVTGRTPVGTWPQPVLDPLAADPHVISIEVN